MQKAAQLIQSIVSASASEVMLNIAASFDNRLLLSLAPLVTDTMFNKASVEMSMRKAQFVDILLFYRLALQAYEIHQYYHESELTDSTQILKDLPLKCLLHIKC